VVGAFAYLGFALNSKIDIGVRHVLPMYPLLVWARAGPGANAEKIQLGAWCCALAGRGRAGAIRFTSKLQRTDGALITVTVFDRLKYDWGQERSVENPSSITRHWPHYLDYFGTQLSSNT